jgi:flagellar motility protein MotE (MotC chaperone)
MRPVRLLPLLAFAAVCLFALKTAGLWLGGGYMLSGAAPASAQSTPSKSGKAVPSQQSGEVAADDKAEGTKAVPENAQTKTTTPPKPADDSAAAANPAAGPQTGAVPPGTAVGAERAVLSSLAERRKELEKRTRELDLRENLLKAAEQRVEARIKKLKAIEQRIETELKKRDDERDAEYAKLVTLYSKMKPKDAARIFNRLDITVLTGLVRRMRPRSISKIFGSMDPAVAERVTMQIADQGKRQTPGAESLPKIRSGDPG